jgi:hypothetical protein
MFAGFTLGLVISAPKKQAAAPAPVAVVETVAACVQNGNAANAYDIRDMSSPGEKPLYRMFNGAVVDAIGKKGELQKQTIVGVTQPRFPGDSAVDMVVDPAARTCTLPGHVYKLR